jgi:hypothetical protein
MYLSALWPHLVKSCCHETDCLRSSTQDLGQYLIFRKERLFKISIVRGLGCILLHVYFPSLHV